MKIDTITIAITLDSGELKVMRFLTRGRGTDLPLGGVWEKEGVWTREANDKTVNAEVRKTFEGHVEKPVSWRIVPESAIPSDRTYRGAWVDVAGTIAHDLTKAKDIHRNRIRAARGKTLTSLDAEYLKADEENDAQAKKRIVDRKKKLRDLPADPRIESASTITDLKQIWDDDLSV